MVTKIIAIHMHFFPDLYAKLRASRCSVPDIKDVLMTWGGGGGGGGRAHMVLKRPPYKTDDFI